MATSTPVHWLDPNDSEAAFPDPEHALREPNGLLAYAGDLSPQRLLRAYRQGIFPWYSEHQPILWWSPDPRLVLYPEQLRISRSLIKTLRKNLFEVTTDKVFSRVINHCAEPRGDGLGTWLTAEMITAYCRLHEMGCAHSVESWYQDELVGGLYGLALGKVFFGESMFSRRDDASKVAFVHLIGHLRKWGYYLIDCQIASPHLQSLGATLITRHHFREILKNYCNVPTVWETLAD